MNVENMKTVDIKPFAGNPRKIPPAAVKAVANSIREFGFLVPVVVDGQGVIVAGHTRHAAAISLGMAEVPCIRADSLTEAQAKAFRVADNSTGTLTGWDWSALQKELAGLDIDMQQFGLDLRDDKPLADQIAESKEWVDAVDMASRNREAIETKIATLAENHPAAFAGADAVILSPDCSKTIVICDPSLKDFITELERYASAGDPSPLSRILEAVHPL